jgi:hypothetical protein
MTLSIRLLNFVSSHFCGAFYAELWIRVWAFFSGVSFINCFTAAVARNHHSGMWPYFVIMFPAKSVSKSILTAYFAKCLSFCVVLFRRKNLQVFRSVVVLNSILVMNYFRFKKRSLEHEHLPAA